jgi:surface polysaccharide O-acyltransferase-like enzyme
MIRASCALLSVVTAYFHFRTDWPNPYFTYEYFDPLVICASLVLFACFSSAQVSCSPTLSRRLQSLAGLTLGIYLVHPLWLDALQKIGLTGLFHP